MSYLLLSVIRIYRYLISPWLGNNCRFIPSCSEYATEAITKYGASKGGWISFRRLCRCHPWCNGGYDPMS
ncbi:MAG: membrane protein insertion efficiency factor YidD [Pseudomonadota bacterium]